MSDPISRVELAKTELDRVMGVGYSAQHPEVFAVVMQSAASDYAAQLVARSLQDIAVALAVEDAPEQGIVAAHRLPWARP